MTNVTKGIAMLVREIMSAQVLTISPNDSAQSAARLMAEAQIGALPVEVPGVGAIVGIVTDGDIVVSVTAKGLSTSTAICEFMTVCPQVCHEDDDIESAARTMADLKVSRLVVTNAERRVVGIVSFADIVRAKPELGELMTEKAVRGAKVAGAAA